MIDRDDPFNIIYSSGTTGLPKGIVHTHAIREVYCTGFASSFRIHPESVMLHSGSLVFNGAFLTLMPAFYLGCTYVLMPRFDPDRLIELVERERVTHTMLVPSQLVALLERPGFGEEQCGSLEMICSVGAPLHLDRKQELERRLPGRFYELYGLTEGFATVLDRDDAGRKPGSVGVPPPLYEMRIVDEKGADLPAGEIGEIVGRGPITMPGYYKRRTSRRRRSARAGSTPATSATSTRTASCISSTARGPRSSRAASMSIRATSRTSWPDTRQSQRSPFSASRTLSGARRPSPR